MDKEILQRDWTVKKLISFIDKDFYKKITNRYDLIKFTKLIVDTFCVELVPARKTSSTFAQYNYNNIEVNNRYYKCFDDMREQNNFYFVAHYFNSIFHELRHHLQYSTNLKNASGILKNYIR